MIKCKPGKYKRFVTNFNNDDLPLYEKALERYIRENKDIKYILYIVDDATDMFGRQLTDKYALECTNHEVLHRFWDIFNNPIEEKCSIEESVFEEEPDSNTIQLKRGYENVPQRHTGPELLSTFDINQLAIYTKAISTFHQITGVNTFSISNNVVDVDTNQSIPNLNALFRVDHSLGNIDDFYTILNVLLMNMN